MSQYTDCKLYNAHTYTDYSRYSAVINYERQMHAQLKKIISKLKFRKTTYVYSQIKITHIMMMALLHIYTQCLCQYMIYTFKKII